MTPTNNQPFGLEGSKLVLAVTIASLVVLGPVAYLISGQVGFFAVLASLVACAVPGLLALLLSRVWTSSNVGLLVVTFVRMGAGLILAVAVRSMWPGIGLVDFYMWLAIVYMISLVADTFAVLQQFTLTRKVG